jgi:hypothetical protein
MERWLFSMVQLDGPTLMVRFIEKINLQSHWAPHKGINRMWTKRNDHAPKNECDNFFYICSKRAILKIKIKLIILLSSSSLPPKNLSRKLL